MDLRHPASPNPNEKNTVRICCLLICVQISIIYILSPYIPLYIGNTCIYTQYTCIYTQYARCSFAYTRTTMYHGWSREGLKGNFNTTNCCFMYLQISVDFNGNLWQESEFQNIEWNLWRESDFQNIYKRENARCVAPSKCCKPFPIHSS